ncbi:MAG TPA: hypothetical protein VLD38_07490 [Nitrosopumilaceae archaeon]|nr:hypothetical protein [Nitrosopumilaceae archaeon]
MNTKNPKMIALLIISFAVLTVSVLPVYAEEIKIPDWIKNNAKWWANGEIDDQTFASGIQFMVKEGIIKIPATTEQANHDAKIPDWIKNNAKWWANGEIDDQTFASGIQFMVKEGIISVSVVNSQNSPNTLDTSRCDQFTTEAEKRTCQKEIEFTNKIQSDIATATPNQIGPVLFYYVSHDVEKTGQGTIVTLDFVVKNTGGKGDVDLFCTGPAACNYSLYDGEKEIVYTQNTLTSGHLLLKPDAVKQLQWVFYKDLQYDVAKNYFLKIKEPWASGQIPLNLD